MSLSILYAARLTFQKLRQSRCQAMGMYHHRYDQDSAGLMLERTLTQGVRLNLEHDEKTTAHFLPFYSFQIQRASRCQGSVLRRTIFGCSSQSVYFQDRKNYRHFSTDSTECSMLSESHEVLKTAVSENNTSILLDFLPKVTAALEKNSNESDVFLSALKMSEILFAFKLYEDSLKLNLTMLNSESKPFQIPTINVWLKVNQACLLNRLERYTEALTVLDNASSSVSQCWGIEIAGGSSVYCDYLLNRSVGHLYLGQHKESLKSLNELLSIDQENIAALSLRIKLYIEKELFDEAVIDTERNLELAPMEADSHFNHAQVLSQLPNRQEEALQFYDSTLAINPKYFNALTRSSFILNELGRYREARLRCDTVIKVDPSNNAAQVERIKAVAGISRLKDSQQDRLYVKSSEKLVTDTIRLMELGQSEKAVLSLSDALDNEPNNAAYLHIRGLCLRELKPDLAGEDFKRAANLQPTNSMLLFHYANHLRLTGFHSEGLDAIDKALFVEPNNANFLCEKGVLLDVLGRNSEALYFCDLAIEQNPEKSIIWHTRGIVLNTLGKDEESLLSFNRALLLEPMDESSLNSKAQMLQKLGRFQEAIDTIAQLPQDSGLMAFGQHLRENCLRQLKEDPPVQPVPEDNRLVVPITTIWGGKGESPRQVVDLEALKEITKILVKTLYERPKDMKKLEQLYTVTEEAKDFAATVAIAEYAVEISDDNAWLNRRGLAYARCEAYDRSLVDLNKFLETYPNHIEALLNRVDCLAHLGRFDSVLSELDQILEVDPLNKLARKKRAAALGCLGIHEQSSDELTKLLADEPNNAQLLCSRALALASLGQTEAALSDFESAVKFAPHDPVIILKYSSQLERLERYEEALACIDQADFVVTDFGDLSCRRGVLLKKMDRLDDALYSCNKALDYAPSYRQALELKSSVLLDQKKYDMALQISDDTLNHYPNSLAALHVKAKSLVALKYYDEALSTIEAYFTYEQNNLDMLRLKAYTLSRLRRFDLALQEMAKEFSLLKTIPDVDFLLLRSFILAKLVRLDEALQDATAALNLSAKDLKVIHNYHKILFAMNRHSEVIPVLDAALNDCPNDPTILCDRGLSLTELGSYQEALADFNKGVATNANELELFNGRAQLLEKMCRYDEALQDCDYVLKLQPNNTDALGNRAWLLYKLNCHDSALYYAELARQKTSATLKMDIDYGVILSASGQHEKALQVLDKAIQAHPNDNRALSSRASVLIFLNKFGDALTDAEGVLSKSPNYAPALVNKLNILLLCDDYSNALSLNREILKIQEGSLKDAPETKLQVFSQMIPHYASHLALLIKLGEIREAEETYKLVRFLLRFLDPATSQGTELGVAHSKLLINFIKDLELSVSEDRMNDGYLLSEIEELSSPRVMSLPMSLSGGRGSLKQLEAEINKAYCAMLKYLVDIQSKHQDNASSQKITQHKKINEFVSAIKHGVEQSMEFSRNYFLEPDEHIKSAIEKDWDKQEQSLLSNLGMTGDYLRSLWPRPEMGYIQGYLHRIELSLTCYQLIRLNKQKCMREEGANQGNHIQYREAFRELDPQLKSEFNAVLKQIRVIQQREGVFPKCFVSYAWGKAENESWVRNVLAEDLKSVLGTERVLLDKKDNAGGKLIPCFVNSILDPETAIILIVATKDTVKKYQGNEASYLKDELRHANLKMRTDPETIKVVFLLREPFVDSVPDFGRGTVPYDFLDPEDYYLNLLKLMSEVIFLSTVFDQDTQKIVKRQHSEILKLLGRFERLQDQLIQSKRGFAVPQRQIQVGMPSHFSSSSVAFFPPHPDPVAQTPAVESVLKEDGPTPPGTTAK
jgi:tetratricopeptide (TPR) repeat protein